MGESMHYYKHNIKDFNAHTAHLTRLERDIYRQMIERYYLTEEIQVYRTRSDKAKDAAAKRWESKGNAKALLTTNNITTKKVTKKKGPPTLKEVCNEFDGRIEQPDEEALSFFNFYESNGWKVGKNPMKSWKAAATNWINRQKKWEKERGSNKQTKQQRRDNALVQLHSE